MIRPNGYFAGFLIAVFRPRYIGCLDWARHAASSVGPIRQKQFQQAHGLGVYWGLHDGGDGI